MEGETAGELDKATEQGRQGLGEAGAEGGREGRHRRSWTGQGYRGSCQMLQAESGGVRGREGVRMALGSLRCYVLNCVPQTGTLKS